MPRLYNVVINAVRAKQAEKLLKRRLEDDDADEDEDVKSGDPEKDSNATVPLV